jgi:predicted NAD/FAD-binding protein
LAEDPSLVNLTLGEFLKQNKYSKEFKDQYIVPMGAAIWSASTRQMEDFPLGYFVRFFKNHGMISIDKRPQWRVIKKGSHSYIRPITRSFAERIHLNSSVEKVIRSASGVTLSLNEKGINSQTQFDQVIMASHSDQTFKMLDAPTEAEKRILSSFSYQPNETILHTDTSLLPRSQRAWAAWNYWIPSELQNRVALTYNMNILQSLTAPETFCVSLNMTHLIDPKKILRTFVYDHPVYTNEAVKAQGEWNQISGKNNTHFCGAYWGFGFHEDGVKSALKVCQSLGVSL